MWYVNLTASTEEMVFLEKESEERVWVRDHLAGNCLHEKKESGCWTTWDERVWVQDHLAGNRLHEKKESGYETI